MKNILIAIALIISTSMFSQEAELRGVVTYFFNDNFGHKPDVGSTILIHKISESNANNALLDKFRSSQVIYNTNVIMSEYINTEDFNQRYQKAKFEYELSEKKAKQYVKDVTSNSSTKTITVDGDGNYNLMLPNGIYEVIAISKNKNDRILYKLVELNGNDIVDFSFEKI